MADIVEIKRKQEEVLDMIRKRSTYIAYSRYSVFLLLDVSGSMSGNKIEDAKEALIHFLTSIDFEENEVGVITFGEGVQRYPLTRDRVSLEKTIKSLFANGGTPMLAAIQTSYEELKDKLNSVMVIATDGQPNEPVVEIIRYSNFVKENDIRIITIGIGSDVNENFLKELASSPEDYHFAKASFELKRIYKEVASDLLRLPENRKQ